jgi:hypothetical protein
MLQGGATGGTRIVSLSPRLVFFIAILANEIFERLLPFNQLAKSRIRHKELTPGRLLQGVGK